MPIPHIKILHVEDIRSDADLVLRELKKSGLSFELLWVATKTDFELALENYLPDLILSDHSLPGFNSIEAFALVKNSSRQIPFILITSTVSEDFAVIMMKEGISDYLLKDRIQRLPEAVINAMEKWQARKQKQEYREETARNERKFRGLIENSNDIIRVLDKDFKPQYTSPNLERITGWSQEEVGEKQLMLLVHPDDLEAVKLVFREAITHPDKIVPFTYRFRHKSGNYIWLDGTVINKLHDESIQGIITNARDVTERKTTEEKISELNHNILLSEAKFRGLIENSEDFIGMINGKGETIYQSPSYWRTTGWTAEEFNQTFAPIRALTFIHPDDRDNINKVAKELVGKPGVPLPLHYRLQHKDGHYLWLDGTITNLHHDKSIQCVVTNLRNITAQKAAESALHNERKLLRSLIDNIPDYIFVKDLNLKHILNNRANVELLGSQFEKETLGKTTVDYVGEQASVYEDDDRHVITTGESLINKEEPLFTARGEKRILLTTKVPLRDEENNITGIIGISRDITDVQNQEKTIRQYRENLDAIFSSTVEEILLLDQEGKIVLFNNAFEKFLLKITGRKPDLGEYIWEMTIDKRKGIARDLFDKALLGETVITEDSLDLPDGYIARELHYEPIVIEGRVKYVSVILNDVTQRKRAEISLQRSQANLSAIIENSDVSIYSLGRDFRYITFNSLLKNTLKQVYELDIQVGDQVFGFLHELDADEAKAWEMRYAEALSGKTLQFIKEFNIGGHRSFTSFSINPIRDHDEITGLSCFAYDVTAEKLADEKVKQSEARYRAMIENNFDALVLRDQNMKMIYSNPSALNLLGLSLDELRASSFDEGFHPDDLAVVTKAKAELFTNPGKPVPMAFRKLHSAGHYVWAEGVMTNMLENPDVKGIVSNFRDVSERKKSEEEKSELVRQLIEKNNDLMQFSFIASHNLRGPVASLLGLVRLFHPNEVQGESAVLIPHIRQATENLDHIIKDISNVLAVRTGEEYLVEPVNIHEAILSVQGLLENQITDAKASFDLTGIEVSEFRTIKTYFDSILYNLISNALKFQSRERKINIAISTCKRENDIILVVRDNGEGIDLERFGDKLFRLYHRFNLNVEGRGLGLYMVKTQVQAMHGSISVQSTVGVGTAFEIIFREN